MPRRPAKVTQADIARAIRAAKQAGASEVTIDAEGVIRFALTANISPVEAVSDPGEEWAPSEELRRYLKTPKGG
jgi:hypothetical protein